jgi:DNA polymerase III delta subunit
MPSLILINGEEEYLIERAVNEEVRSSLADEVLHFYAPSGVEEYLKESSCSIFGIGKRAYVIWDATEVPNLPENNQDLLIVVSGKKALTHPTAKQSLKFSKLKAYPENNEVLKWIMKEGDRHNIDLTRVAGALFVNCGTTLRKLANEIDKLALITPKGKVVAPESVRSILCFSAELSPREIIDAICDGHTARAIAFLDKLQERNDETGWIVAYMQRHVLQQLRFELLAEQKTPDDRAAMILGVHPFVLKKMYLTRRGVWTKKSLQQSIDTLCELDISHKRGSHWARFGLELEIIRLSEESKDVKR